MKLDLAMAFISILWAAKADIYSFSTENVAVATAILFIGIVFSIKWFDENNFSISKLGRLISIKMRQLRIRKLSPIFNSESPSFVKRDPLDKSSSKTFYELCIVILLLFIKPSLMSISTITRIVSSWMVSTLIILANSRKLQMYALCLPAIGGLIMPFSLALLSLYSGENLFTIFCNDSTMQGLIGLGWMFHRVDWVIELLIGLSNQNKLFYSAFKISCVYTVILSFQLVVTVLFILSSEIAIKGLLKITKQIDKILGVEKRLIALEKFLYPKKNPSYL